MAEYFWRDAAKGGIIIGAIVVAATYIKTWLAMSDSTMGLLFSLLEFAAVAYCLYRFCKQRSALYDSLIGYSYGQNMGFVLGMMLLTGVIYGIGQYFLVNYFAPEFYAESFDTAFELMEDMMGDAAVQGADMAYRMIRNPLYWLFYGVIAMVMYGGLIGLFVSALVKRNPDLFANNNPQNE